MIQSEGLFAILETKKGSITVKLEFEKVPMTVANFVGLAEGSIENTARSGKPFFDGLTFHRVVPGFVIQGGCPNGTGAGGPGYRFPDEIDETLRHDAPGVLSMANAGPHTNGSQFFITMDATPHLDGVHTVFGRVVDGMDVVEKIKAGDKIEKVTIVRNGDAAKAFDTSNDAFRRLVADAMRAEADRIRAAVEAGEKEADRLYPNAEKTASGLRYIVIRDGEGKSPGPRDIVTVDYEGCLLGTDSVFDSSYRRGEPLKFRVEQVIPGWQEALQMMKRGSEWRVIIHPDLGYGAAGAPPVIPPYAWLDFRVELHDF